MNHGIPSFGRLAFEAFRAYLARVGLGAEVPFGWDMLGSERRAAWEAAGLAVVRAATRGGPS